MAGQARHRSGTTRYPPQRSSHPRADSTVGGSGRLPARRAGENHDTASAAGRSGVRQIVLAAAGELRIEEGPLPEPAPDELRVRAEAVGICGSDLHAFAGEHPFIDLPVVPGHEAAGVVDAVGEGVKAFAPGDHVLLEPNLIDHHCLYCQTGRYNLCEHLQVVGCQTSGALADAFVAPAERFHRIPTGLTMAEAAMVEPLSTATHAVRVADGVRERTVAVLGAGSIGLLT